MIRHATKNDVSRIAEILVFSKRMNYREIFQNDAYSFGELQVDAVAKQSDDEEFLSHTWVYTETLITVYGQKHEVHFFGNIVYVTSNMGGRNEYLIIDGHQRMGRLTAGSFVKN